MRIGVVSDTHGLLRPEVAPALAGVERILHLGDVGKPEILKELDKIAPVTAVRGNIDTGGPCSHLPETEVVMLGDRYLYLLHGPGSIAPGPSRRKICRRALWPLARPQFLQEKGRALLQSRLMRTPAVRVAGHARHSHCGRRRRPASRDCDSASGVNSGVYQSLMRGLTQRYTTSVSRFTST